MFRIPVYVTVSKEYRRARNWDDEEIDEIIDLMAESFSDRSMTLFYRNGTIILITYFLADYFFTNVPLEALGMVFIMYGAILAGYSIHGPYRIAIEGLDKDERYFLLKRHMARETMLVTMGAIFFVGGFFLRIIVSIF